MALQSGRVTTDVIGGIGLRFAMFEQADATVDLRDLPGWSNIPDGAKDPNGLWIAQPLVHGLQHRSREKGRAAEGLG
jgi:hypothetical protein